MPGNDEIVNRTPIGYVLFVPPGENELPPTGARFVHVAEKPAEEAAP